LKKFSFFGPFLSQLFATITKSLWKFDEKKSLLQKSIDIDTRTEFSNQFRKYLLTFIHSAQISPKLFDMGASREKFRSVRSRKWGPTALPATTLLNFALGAPSGAKKAKFRVS
jgi:hypothetical protein